MWLFVQPWFLWAALAAVVPLILHLMRHRRKESIYFPSLRFLKLAQKKSARRMHLEHFLIWFLRTLMLLLLALAFALPVVRTSELGGWIGRVARDVAIVWDNSYGMDYQTGNRHLWEESRQAVLNIIEGLEPGDRVSIHVTAGGADPLLRELTSDREMASSLVRAERVTPYPGQLAPAMAGAVYSLRESGNREKEVFVVTNGQESAFSEFSVVPDQEALLGRPERTWNPDAVDPSIAFFLHMAKTSQPTNTTPSWVEVQPSLVLRETRPRLRARVAHFGPPTQTTLSLIHNGEEIQRRSLHIEQDQEEELLFNLPALPAGKHHFRLETPPDALSGDNTFDFILQVRDRFPIALTGPRESRFFLERALSVGGDQSPLDLHVLEPSALASGELGHHPAIFLANALPLSDEIVLALENYVRGGGVVVLFPGDRASVEDYANWSMLPAKPAGFSEPPSQSERRALHFLAPTHPVFRALQLQPGSVPAVGLRREVVWERPDEAVEESVTHLLGMGRDNVFLQTRRFGQGRILLFSVSADRTWSDFPLSPLFLPFVHQIVQYAAGVREDTPYQWLDRVVEIPAQVRAIPEGSTLRNAIGDAFPLRRVQRDDARRIQVESLSQPGVYFLDAPGAATPEPIIALNIRREESDVRTIPETAVPERVGLPEIRVASSISELDRLIEEHRIGKPLTELLLWLVLVAALFEWWLANRASRPVASLGESLKVDASGRVRSNPSAHDHPAKS